VNNQSQHWLESLEKQGWFAFTRHIHRPRLSAIAKRLGLSQAKQARLTASEAEHARPNTLSSRYGLGTFPLHSDFALDETPPRYVILYAPHPRPFATVLWDAWQVPMETRSQAIFLIDEPRRRKYVRFEQVRSGRPIIRYNSAVFTPQKQLAEELTKQIEMQRGAIKIKWTERSSVIIDNWRILHGREKDTAGRGGFVRRVAGWVSE
jgi:alpha-ketoglutarate-dependent taurine dioxygenase